MSGLLKLRTKLCKNILSKIIVFIYFEIRGNEPGPANTFRYIVPMRNGDVDVKGILSSILSSVGTMEAFQV